MDFGFLNVDIFVSTAWVGFRLDICYRSIDILPDNATSI